MSYGPASRQDLLLYTSYAYPGASQQGEDIYKAAKTTTK